MTDFQYALHRLRRADSIEALNKLETSLERLYNNGVFTPTEYRLLDIRLVDKLIKLENQQ